MKSRIDQVIDNIFPSLSKRSRQQIMELCEAHTTPEGQAIVEKGKRDHYEYFLVDGVARSQLMNQDGEAVTLLFFDGPDVLSPHVTRTQDHLSLFSIDAITDCSLLRIRADDFEKMLETNLEIREFANTILRRELFQKTQKEIQLVSWSAKERLEQFRNDYRMLENRVPHGMIASYLGITNVSLSRLRQNN